VPADTLTLWNLDRCPYCSRVRIALAEKGLAWRDRPVDLADKPPELLALNPAGAVPVLVDGEAVVPESLVILEYLEDRFPERPLLPRDAAGRARVRLACSRAFEPLAGALGRLVKAPPEGRMEAAVQVREAMVALEREAPAHGFWLGPFSAADAALAPFVLRLPAELSPRALGVPRLAAWLERVGQRPWADQERSRLTARSP
jgi:glutathione S-transferase